MTLPANMLTAFTDAAADRIARAIVQFRRDGEREAAIREAEYRARMADLERMIVSVGALEKSLADRIAALKNGEPGRDGLSVTVDDVLPHLASSVDQAVALHVERLLDGWDRPQDGKSVGLDDVEPLIRDAVADAVSKLPVVTVEDMLPAVLAPLDDAVSRHVERLLDGWDRPRDGKSVGLDDVEPMIRDAVADAVSQVPVVTVEDMLPEVLAPLDDAVARHVERLLDAWDRPEDGKSVGLDDVEPLIRQAVTDAVAMIPAAKDGEPGPPGPMGSIAVATVWEDKVYYQGEVVSHDGSVFQALRDTGKPPGHGDWACIVRAGKDGADGRSFAIRGTWQEGEGYRALDVVMLNGASFVAVMDDPGACPGDGWQLLAAQGKRGKPGEPGPAGVGLRGLPGATVSSLTVDGDGMLTLLCSDGTEVRCDLYPLLSKL